ncbi:MAG: TetR/AcrR family transcriptional regulator [Candidatus Kariarchaeaceae archaeon]|jgi:AcrR family transcriptional regulator
MSDKRKEQILSAASQCFARFGYKKTTLEDIGKMIGLNKASIYYYFKNKEEIFTTIALGEFKQFMDKLHQRIEEKKDCEAKILEYFENNLRFWSEQSSVLTQLTEIEPADLQHLMASGREIYIRIEDGEKLFFSKILQDCIKNGHIQDCDVKKTTEFMFALADGIKDRYIGFTGNKRLAVTERENMVKDVQTALIIFINGLK